MFLSLYSTCCRFIAAYNLRLKAFSRSSNPFSAVNYKRAQAKIKEGIKTLPEKQRLVLSLYYFEDLNLKEIGQVLDVTESRVSQLHTQAILKLKAKLKNDFESHEDLAA